MEKSLSRKERRQMEEQRTFYRNMKKRAAVLGTTVTAVSAVAPLSPVITVLADESDTYIEQTTPSEAVQTTNSAVQSVNAEEEMQASSEATETPVVTETPELPAASEVVEENNVAETPVVPEASMEDPSMEEVEVNEEPLVIEEPALVEEAQSAVQAPTILPFSAGLARASAFVDPQTFINTIAQQAKAVADANDLYVSVMIAQAIIESGWGSSTLSKAPNYNLFGIKGSYNGQTVYMSTLEYLNGQWVTKNEPFKKYPSFAESFADNAATLRNVSFQSGVYYYSGAWKSNTKSYRDATAWLTGRYATDPNYASKLNSTIEMYQLTRFDSPATGNNQNQTNTGNGNPVINTGTGSGSNTGSSTDTAKTYTVKSGDSIWLIANNHGISMDQLRSWNNLKSDLIHAGQKLIVGQSSQAPVTPEAPTPTPTPTPETSKPETSVTPSTAKTYTVKSGDSVWLIANNHGITMAQLRSWNNLKNDLIHPGQKLVVSQTGTTNTGTTAKPTAPTNTNTSNNATNNTTSKPTTSTAKTYTVKFGDSVWLIANNHGITMAQLRSWNNLKSDLIHPNQKLIVSQASGTSTGTTTKPVTSTNTNVGTTTKPTTPTNTNNSSNSSNATTTTAKTYTVKAGDSVWLIANKHGITMDQLRNWNNLKSDLIHPNQTLKVSNASTSSNTVTTKPVVNQTTAQTTTNTSNEKSHKVVSGDSLWMLSQKYNLSIAQLKTLNSLTSDTIYVGQTLKVR